MAFIVLSFLDSVSACSFEKRKTQTNSQYFLQNMHSMCGAHCAHYNFLLFRFYLSLRSLSLQNETQNIKKSLFTVKMIEKLNNFVLL